MKVFISHTFFDEDLKLAENLKQILKENGIDGYLAETRREYDRLIRDKIIDEIKKSDHMIAILTEKSFDSASVNQELGYALREGILPVIMLEKKAKQGVLTFGIDPEEFTKETFSESCIRVLKHINDKGMRPKVAENLSDLSEKMDKIESKIDNPQSNVSVDYSDKYPEDKWYDEIMRVCFVALPEEVGTASKDAKEYYSKIQILRQEIHEISNSYNNAGAFEKPNLASILNSKRKSLKDLLESLRRIWVDISG